MVLPLRVDRRQALALGALPKGVFQDGAHEHRSRVLVALGQKVPGHLQEVVEHLCLEQSPHVDEQPSSNLVLYGLGEPAQLGDVSEEVRVHR